MSDWERFDHYAQYVRSLKCHDWRDPGSRWYESLIIRSIPTSWKPLLPNLKALSWTIRSDPSAISGLIPCLSRSLLSLSITFATKQALPGISIITSSIKGISIPLISLEVNFHSIIAAEVVDIQLLPVVLGVGEIIKTFCVTLRTLRTDALVCGGIMSSLSIAFPKLERLRLDC
jgi:hypothetical protein